MTDFDYESTDLRDEVKHILTRSPKTFFSVGALAEMVGYSESVVRKIVDKMAIEKQSVKLSAGKGRGIVIVRWGK